MFLPVNSIRFSILCEARRLSQALVAPYKSHRNWLLSTNMMINGRFNGCCLLLILFLHNFPSSTKAYNLHPLAGQSISSHSGPTNALYGHEKFHDEPLSFEQRQKRNVMWGNNYVYQNTGWPNMLVSSEPPNGYMTGYLSGEHNRYRRMVSLSQWMNALSLQYRN